MWEKTVHRLLADFLVGDRVFEIVLESLGLSPEPSDQQLRSWLSRFLEPHQSPLSGSAFAYRYGVMGICPLHTPDHGLEEGLQAALGIGGASDACFSGFFGEVADKMGET